MDSIGPNFTNLNKITLLAKKDRQKALRQVCQEFEALFLYQVLKEMQKTVPQSGFWPKSFSEELYKDLYYQEVGREIAKRGTGLGKMLYQELSKKYGGVK